MSFIQRMERFMCRKLNRRALKSADTEYEQEPYVPVASDYPVFPPPPPSIILQEANEYWGKVQIRKFAAPCGESGDKPLFALYRLYEAFVLDQRFAYRNILESFWRKPAWKISEIPDPIDSNPSRYAFLAGATYLMADSFNARVAIGLTRDARPLMSMEEAEEAKKVPDSERPYETVPEWAERVPALDSPLSIPTMSGELLSGINDERASPDFLKKNIIIWTPHIYFT